MWKIFRLWMTFEKKHFDLVNWASRWIQTEFHLSKYLIEEFLCLVMACLLMMEALYSSAPLMQFGSWVVSVIVFLLLAMISMSDDHEFEENGTVVAVEHKRFQAYRMVYILVVYGTLCWSAAGRSPHHARVFAMTVIMYLWMCVVSGDCTDKGDRRHLWSFLFA